MSTASHRKTTDVLVDLLQWRKNKSGRARILFLSISKSVRACWTHMFDVPIMLNAHQKRKEVVSNTTEATPNLLMFFLFLSLCVDGGAASSKKNAIHPNQRQQQKAMPRKSEIISSDLRSSHFACVRLFLFYFFRVCSSRVPYGPFRRHR